MSKSQQTMAISAILVLIVVAWLLVPIVTETAARGPSDFPNSAFVTPDYPKSRIPWFIDIDDNRETGKRGTAVYMTLPATNGHELRVYPEEIDEEVVRQFLMAEALLGADVYVEEVELTRVAQ